MENRQTTLAQIERRKYEQQIIDAVLGNDKYLRLNLQMSRVLGLEQTALITFILDRTRYALNLDKHFEGVKIYRDELLKQFGWSEYQQRRIETSLKEKKVLNIQMVSIEKQRYNLYGIDIEKLLEVMDTDTSKN
jgi:hypothetical protein